MATENGFTVPIYINFDIAPSGTALHIFIETNSGGEYRLCVSHFLDAQATSLFVYQDYFYSQRGNELQPPYIISVNFEAAQTPPTSLPTDTPRGSPDDYISTTTDRTFHRSLHQPSDSINRWLEETPGQLDLYAAVGEQFVSPGLNAPRDLAATEDMLRELDDILQGNLGQQVSEEE
ncbi:hypothetical protein ABW19_dt0202492 [Dactylella cylindrospora]|nr:hypothetical protein ABW19_dt0202492 [Dactylella cylindrospora]